MSDRSTAGALPSGCYIRNNNHGAVGALISIAASHGLRSSAASSWLLLCNFC